MSRLLKTKKKHFFIFFWLKLYISCLKLGTMMDKVVTNILSGKTTNKKAARQREIQKQFVKFTSFVHFYRGL